MIKPFFLHVDEKNVREKILSTDQDPAPDSAKGSIYVDYTDKQGSIEESAVTAELENQKYIKRLSPRN